MPEQLAPVIRSLSGDNAGHVMTGTSPGTGPVTGDRSGQQPVIGDQSKSLVNEDRSDPPVNGDRFGHRSDPLVTGHLLLMTGPTHWSPVIYY
ncbi:hypothetical protein DPMN_126805 [Dreissena polymorpha]|uniref:Uncharacterized protein n=1 Tax=Dreissena polymorpha TaxID=45954 RepID=A0A9D4JUA0_DREPO|nr:hypothetical protein DPMN_126805 [Dreissena polymorpha]